MLRKTTVALAALLVATTAAVVPANAAVSNGTACAKKNATTKVGSDKYVCTTNPTTTSKKLVWVWQGCLDANKAYLSTKSQYDGILKQLSGTTSSIQTTIQNSINAMINWKATKNYVKDDVVYETGKTYYVALADNKGKQPSTALGTIWAVYQPTAADANVGTSPDVSKVIAWKEKDVLDWTESATALQKDITRLQGLKNPTAKETANIATYKTLVSTLNIGIKNANTNIKNLKANVILLSTQATNQATVLSLKADVDQAKMIRAQSCAKGV